MEEKLADDLIVIGYNPDAYAFVFNSLRCELENRIEVIQDKLQNSKNQNNQSFCSKNAQEIIGEYLKVPLKQQNKNPLYWREEKLTEELASAYLLCRFIGSSVNANMRQNTFKSCFSNNWDSYSKHLLKESLSPEEEKEVSRNIGHALFQLDYRVILSQTGFDSSNPEKSEEAVRLIVTRLANFAEEINKEKFKASLFSGDPKQVMSTVSFSLLQACEFIRNKGGAVEYLRLIDNVVHDETKTDHQKVKDLADEVKANIKGFADALSRDFFKEMGYGIFSKPDVHVMDLIARLNLHLYYEWGTTDEERAAYLLSEIAKSVPGEKLTANQVDKVFWLLKSGNFHLHQLPRKHRLSDIKCSVICKEILNKLQSEGICAALTSD